MSEETPTPKRRGRPPATPPRIDVMERSSQTQFDQILEDVIKRREAEPFGHRSRPIALTDPHLVPHWINRDKYPDAIAIAKEKGWRGVRLEQVVDHDQLGDHGISPDGYVVRGERGNEILMCMPQEYVNRVAAAKVRESNKKIGDPFRQKQDVIEAYGQRNPDGAELVAQGDVHLGGRMKTTRERIAVVPAEE